MRSVAPRLTVFAALWAAVPVQAGLLITQYYEGASNNKWVELTNTSSNSIDLSGFKIGIWTNASTENWKTATGTPNNTISLTGTLAPAVSFLVGNSAAVLPSYAVANLSTGSLSPNGDDSIVLYTNASGYATTDIVDAVGFTDAGNEGGDTSWVRVSLGTGYSLTTGSTVVDFPAVWSQASNSAVDNAAVGTNERLGVFLVPEPSALALGGLGLVAGCSLAARRLRGRVSTKN